MATGELVDATMYCSFRTSLNTSQHMHGGIGNSDGPEPE